MSNSGSAFYFQTATDAVPGAVRDERQAALFKQAGLSAFDFEPAATSGNDMKHHAPLERG